MSLSKKKFILPIAFGLLALSCGRETKQEVAKTARTGIETAKVREAAQARMKAIAEGDVERYLAAYHDEAVWMPPDARAIIGKPAARQLLQGLFADSQIDIGVSSSEQVVMGDKWILDRGSYVVTKTTKSGSGGEASGGTGTYVTLWQRQSDGAWKILYDIWNRDRPPSKTELQGGES